MRCDSCLIFTIAVHCVCFHCAWSTEQRLAGSHPEPRAAPAVEILAPGGPHGMRQLAYQVVPSLELRIESRAPSPTPPAYPPRARKRPPSPPTPNPSLSLSSSPLLLPPSPSSSLPTLSSSVSLSWKQLAGPALPFSSPAIAPTTSLQHPRLAPGTLKPGPPTSLALTASRAAASSLRCREPQSRGSSRGRYTGASAVD